MKEENLVLKNEASALTDEVSLKMILHRENVNHHLLENCQNSNKIVKIKRNSFLVTKFMVLRRRVKFSLYNAL